MKLITILSACSVLLPAQSMRAQARETAADRISGTWTGTMRPNEVPDNQTGGNRITLELKFDGKGAIVGTVTGPPQPGEIKTGTFDPETGALKFAVEVPSNTDVFVFEGTVVQGTATGRVTAGSRRGVFIITKATGMTKAAGESAAPQQAGGTDPAGPLRKSFGEVSGWVSKAAELVPADKYNYRPAQSVRTFGQLIGHIADAYNYYCSRATGRSSEWSDAIEKGGTDKATLAPKLKQSLEACTAAYGSPGQIGPLIENVGHTNLHYGNIITYMRMLGMVPPSS